MNVSCGLKIKLIYAALGISAGLMAGTVFWISYKNYLATALAYFSSVCATFLFYLHWAYHRRWMTEWSPLRTKLISVTNSVIYLLGISGMSICITLAIVWGETITAEGLKGNNLWIAAVWCWMTFKWAFATVIYLQKYAQNVMSPLLSPNDCVKNARYGPSI